MNRTTIFSVSLINKKPKLFSNFSSSTQLPNTIRSCISSLQASALHNNLSKGKEIHAQMLVNGFLSSPPSITSLINFYSKSNQPHHALTIFNGTTDRNLFIWNAIIAGFVNNNLPKDAFQFYKALRYRDNILPDKFTIPCVVKACCDLKQVAHVGKIHAELFKIGLDTDVFISTSLINFYLKFSYMVEARQIFEELPKLDRDVVLWNAVITGYTQIGLFTEALEVFGAMVEEGLTPSKFTVTGILSLFAMVGDAKKGMVVHGFVKKFGYESDVVVSNSLIDMYGKCKYIGEAVHIFEEMPERDIFSWNSIISVHEQSADYDGTLRLFYRMRDAGVQPDIVTITSVLPACSHLAALMHGREIHGFMIVNSVRKDDLDNVYVDNAVMDMYAKCGSLKDAQMLFDKMKVRDTASWNIMIMGYGMHGRKDDALAMFSQMCEMHIRPDEVTFVSVLSACSHAGLVDLGCEILKQMEIDHGVIPTVEHYACVVDMLGRAGHLDKAYKLALTMPTEPNPVVWRALLSACRLHHNAPLAEIVSKQIFELEPEYCGSYVLISNIYGSTGRYEEVSDTRQTMRTQNVRKTPGCSWVEQKNGVHVFVTGDTAHTESCHIYFALDALFEHLCECGRVQDVAHAYHTH